jgi:hypothetical protein
LTFVSDIANEGLHAGPPEKRTEPRLIICEGHSDHGVLLAISRVLNLSGAQLHVARGRGNFSNSLRGARLQGYKAVLLVSDNDDDPDNAWSEVCSQIRDADYEPPKGPREVVLDDKGGPSLRVLMIPWDKEKGAIEMLCLPALEALFADKVKCVNEFCNCTEIDKNWGVTARSIARVECILACTHETEPKIGLGHFVIRTKCPLDFKHDCFKRIGESLRTFSPG